MDNVNPNQMPPISQVNMGENKKGMGPIIAVIVILALIIVGGLYFLKNQSENKTYAPESDTMVETLETQGTSDDIDSIEADLNATDFDNLDQGAAVIEAELQ